MDGTFKDARLYRRALEDPEIARLSEEEAEGRGCPRGEGGGGAAGSSTTTPTPLAKCI